MLLFVAALIVATVASGAWCAGAVVPDYARPLRWGGGSIATVAFALAAALGVAAALRMFVVPAHHAMYLDEPWYAEAACNLRRFGRLVLCEETWSGAQCVDYEKAWGWPVLLAAWTMLVGCATTVGIDVNRIIGTATVLLVAATARAAGAGWWPSMIPAALLATYPMHAEWSATGETNVSAAAALLAGVSGAVLYVRSGRRCGAALAISALALATAIRPESFVPAAVAAIVVVLVARPRFGQRMLIGAAIILVSGAAAAAGLQLVAMNESISGGAFLSLENVLRNAVLLAHADSFVPNGGAVLIGLAGAAVMLARPHERGTAALLLGTVLAAALVALAYDRFHPRMLLGAIVCLLPASAFLFEWRTPLRADRAARLVPRALLGLAALGVVLLQLHAIRSMVPSETQVLETRIASRVAGLSLSGDPLFITEQPPVLTAAGVPRVMATATALQDVRQLTAMLAAGRPVYFLRDMYCEAGFQGAATPRLCDELLARFAVEPVAEETLHSRTYVLYRLAGARDAPVSPG